MILAKKLIIASTLSMIAASCYAGSLVTNTISSVSANITFNNPGQLNTKLTPLSGLKAGQHQGGESIAELAVSGTVGQYAVTGDYSKPEVEGNQSDTWRVTGKNGNVITVTFGGVGCSNKGVLTDNASHKWWIYNMSDKVNVKLASSQNIKADTYPVTLNVAAYQA
ncbi:Saf-pilin pilus formation protein SafA [Escherichia coli]|nr:Saf-pilin pilus formation protein SafA [Escherichia coli]